MKIVIANLWDSIDDIILVTSNSYVNQRGELVMGRGAALELKNKFPYLAGIFGDQVKRYYEHLGKYGVLISKYEFLDKMYGIFQVKYHFGDRANLELIDYSVNMLNSILKEQPFEKSSVSMNFPGIGFGHLLYEQVLPVVEKLNDRVTLYMKD